MAALPSYQEAVGRSDWLEIVAHYVSLRDYASLCRVSRSFHRLFAPRLWNDPLKAARLRGLHPNNGEWQTQGKDGLARWRWLVAWLGFARH